MTGKGQTGLNGYGLVHRADEDYLKEMNIPCKVHLVTPLEGHYRGAERSQALGRLLLLGGTPGSAQWEPALLMSMRTFDTVGLRGRASHISEHFNSN